MMNLISRMSNSLETVRNETRPVAVDLFCGCGGLSLGATLSGIDVKLAIDKDASALETYAHNIIGTKCIKLDFPSEINKMLDLIPHHEVLLSGPPCQSFSTSNQKSRQDSNPLNELLFIPVLVVREFSPKVVVVENVEGLSIGSRKRYLDRLILDLQECGYYVSVNAVKGVQVGLPQSRTRLFIVGIKNRYLDFNFVNVYQPTVRDAIADLPKLSNGADIDCLPYSSAAQSVYAEILRNNLRNCSGHLVTKSSDLILRRYKNIPMGGNWKDIPESLMQNYTNSERCHSGVYYRLCYEKPAKVVGNFRKNMLIHPGEHRGISIREAARLQSFPDSYNFKGSIGKRQQQVGNAVPPIMAQAFLTRILEVV